ncbi:hypothetical protein FSP39_020071 [Pinctada imbricata]|uniref:Uncharacterized protein n=1 Tax=Pinctada imbricata TaxID=66713 RepID=A0AA89BTD9_PINIB|nr:hypothetical protein FSP39_020071 [Pinctada imbricata]
MAISSTEMEVQSVIHWFQGWSPMQKGDFMKDLIDKAVPVNVDSLFDSMHTLNVKDRPPSIFQCQLRLFTQWFETWSEKDRNDFMIKLRIADPAFVAKFDEEVKLLMQKNCNGVGDG